MKKTLLILAASAAILSTTSGCAKCVVCSQKDGDEYHKFEVCDKEYDKDDIDDAIESAESNGYKCHAKSRAL